MTPLFGDSDAPEEDPLAPLRAAEEEAGEAHRAYEAARNRRVAREERLGSLREEAARAEKEAERISLLPGSRSEGGAGTATATRHLETIEREVRDLEEEESRARERWIEAQSRVRDVARELVPEIAEEVREIRRERTRALASVGRAVLEALAEAEEARAAGTEAEEALRDAIRAAGADRAAEREVHDYLDAPAREAGPEAVLGYFVRRISRWVSRAGSKRPEIRALFEEAGLPVLEGSILWGPGTTGSPPVALDDAYRVAEGRPLPL